MLGGEFTPKLLHLVGHIDVLYQAVEEEFQNLSSKLRFEGHFNFKDTS